jgi:hypothetical protein
MSKGYQGFDLSLFVTYRSVSCHHHRPAFKKRVEEHNSDRQSRDKEIVDQPSRLLNHNIYQNLTEF